MRLSVRINQFYKIKTYCFKDQLNSRYHNRNYDFTKLKLYSPVDLILKF